MSNNHFHFKQFSIVQDQCAMKVGTDGVLLGAWADMPKNKGVALDIGTGTGLVALMLAQRFPQCRVIGVEIDEKAARQAVENVQLSPWKKRVSIQNNAIQSFVNISDTTFDCIVSNPPFFAGNGETSFEERTIARHENTLGLDDLFAVVSRLLSKEGTFSLILPVNRFDEANNMAEKEGLFCIRKCIVYPNKGKSPKRVLLSYTFEKATIHIEELTIEMEKRHQYTEEYKALLKAFYLAF